jgi:signal transduction histidine kinase
MPDSRRVRIAIVDNDVSEMRPLSDALAKHGYETVGFSSSQLVLQALRDEKFELLLADLRMPELDGVALLRAATARDTELVGIIMTGHGTIDGAVQAMQAGALDYIRKPFEVSVILPVLARALKIRTFRLTNARLEREVLAYAARLELANRDLEAFAYSVSHDLRGPLRHVLGFAEVLRATFAERFPLEAVGILEKLMGSAKRMDQLIEDLLRLSRMSNQPLAKQIVNVEKLVQTTLNELRNEEAGRRADVRVAELPAAFADPPLLRQVLVNLLSNAFKFSRHREGALIEVGGEARAEESEYFVRDNGAGFDAQYAKRLFGVFQRLHADEAFEGTGVGLSIVRRIIERHGGRVWAEGAVNQGATFHFTLPSRPPLGAAEPRDV